MGNEIQAGNGALSCHPDLSLLIDSPLRTKEVASENMLSYELCDSLGAFLRKVIGIGAVSDRLMRREALRWRGNR